MTKPQLLDEQNALGESLMVFEAEGSEIKTEMKKISRELQTRI